MQQQPPPLLLFAYGNPSRGDDAVAPALLESLAKVAGSGELFECLTDFQLQVEHIFDLRQRHLVIFIDATEDNRLPLQFTPLLPQRDAGYSSHALHPSALLFVWQQLEKTPPPLCYLLAISGNSFTLGEPLTPMATTNLHAALTLLQQLLQQLHTHDTTRWPALCQAYSTLSQQTAA
ncbi:MAG: hydrogenase maturation protease [Gammaproteobacteria bacterium]|nr:hydrogenase maturation protease [Gammaproteobacteria bacterium]